MNLTPEQTAAAEAIRWRFSTDQGEYTVGWCIWARHERLAIHFTSGPEHGEVYVWRRIGISARNGRDVDRWGWWRTGPTVRGRFREGGNRHD